MTQQSDFPVTAGVLRPAFGRASMCAHTAIAPARAEPSAGEREGHTLHDDDQRSLCREKRRKFELNLLETNDIQSLNKRLGAIGGVAGAVTEPVS